MIAEVMRTRVVNLMLRPARNVVRYALHRTVHRNVADAPAGAVRAVRDAP